MQRPIRFSIVIICKISQNICWIVLLVTVSGLRVQLVGATTVPLKIESTSLHESFITGLLFTELRLLLRAKSVRSAYYSALVQGKPNKTLKLWLSLQTFRHGVQLYFRNNFQLQLTNYEEKMDLIVKIKNKQYHLKDHKMTTHYNTWFSIWINCFQGNGVWSESQSWFRMQQQAALSDLPKT